MGAGRWALGRHRESVAFLVPSLLLLASCAPPYRTVFVDVGRVIATDRPPKVTPVSVPSPPPAIPPTTVVQSGRTPESLRDPSRSTESDVRQAIRNRQHQDFLRLVQRLKEFYSADALRFEQEQMRSEGSAAVEAYDKANATIRREFIEYGEKRGPLVAELTLLVGFPDPNPTSKTPNVPMGNVDRQRFERAKSLREQIQALEAQFDARVAEVIGAVSAQLHQNLNALQERIRQYRIANDERATREAAAQVQESAGALGLKLTEPMRLTLPGIPEHATVLPGAPAPQAPPKVTSEGVLTAPEDRELLIRRQVAIWAAQRRYVVASKPGPEDRTEEFMRWRNALLSGR